MRVSEGENNRLGEGLNPLHFYFDGTGLAAAGKPFFSPEDAVRIGQALGRLHPRGMIGAAAGGSPASRALMAALAAGIAQTGGTVWDFGDCFESQCGYCISRSAADWGVYADVSSDTPVRIFSRGGLPLSAGEKERLLELLEKGAPPSPYSSYGGILAMSSMRELYGIELIKSAVCTLSGMSVSVKCASSAVRALAEEALSRLGCRFAEGGLTLQISADGRNVSAYDKVSDYIFTDRVLLLVCMDLFRRGQDASVPASAPRVLDRIAARWGRRALRYEDGFVSDSDRSARNLGMRQPFLRDGLMLGIRLLSLLRENQCSLEELEKRLPGYAVVSRTVAAGRDLLPPGERGVCFPLNGGEIRLCPARAGRAIFLVAEGANVEMAGELCRFAEEELSNHRLPQGDRPQM